MKKKTGKIWVPNCSRLFTRKFFLDLCALAKEMIGNTFFRENKAVMPDSTKKQFFKRELEF